MVTAQECEQCKVLRDEIRRLTPDTGISPWPEKIKLEFTESQWSEALAQALDERDHLSALCEKLASVTEMFVGYCTDDFAPTPMKMAREILAEYRSYKNDHLR